MIDNRSERGTAKARLLEAAVDVIRAQGYNATTIDDLCRSAGVTKGAFFHHFESKEALAVAAAGHWSDTTGQLFANADYHRHDDPTARVLGYVDFRRSLIGKDPATFSCLVGTMTQEAFATNHHIRDACAASILGHAERLEADIEAALSANARADGVSAASLAVHTQVVLQGAFVVSKATDDPAVAIDSIDHLRRYLTTQLEPTAVEPTRANRNSSSTHAFGAVDPTRE